MAIQNSAWFLQFAGCELTVVVVVSLRCYVKPPFDAKGLGCCARTSPCLHNARLHIANRNFDWLRALRLWCYGPPSLESRLGHRDFHTFRPLKETWLARRFQKMTTWTSCNVLATNTWHEFLISWSTSLAVVMGQMPKWQWWLLGRLMFTIC